MSAEGIVTVFSETTATTRVLWCSTVRVRWPNQKAKRRMDRALHKCHWSLAASVGSSKHSHLKPDCDLRHVTPTWLWSRETEEKAKRKMREQKWERLGYRGRQRWMGWDKGREANWERRNQVNGDVQGESVYTEETETEWVLQRQKAKILSVGSLRQDFEGIIRESDSRSGE